MGDGAINALNQSIRSGWKVSNRPIRKRKLVRCPECPNYFRGKAGVMQHRNEKHGTKFTWAEICNVPVGYE